MANRIFDKLVSVQAQKRFGRPRFYGSCQYGFAQYGESEEFIDCAQYGSVRYGDAEYGEIYMLTGIWKKYKVGGVVRNTRVGYYHPKDPRSANQILWRGKMRDVVSAWHALGTPEKMNYNRLARSYKMTGFNLFIKRNIANY